MRYAVKMDGIDNSTFMISAHIWVKLDIIDSCDPGF